MALADDILADPGTYDRLKRDPVLAVVMSAIESNEGMASYVRHMGWQTLEQANTAIQAINSAFGIGADGASLAEVHAKLVNWAPSFDHGQLHQLSSFFPIHRDLVNATTGNPSINVRLHSNFRIEQSDPTYAQLSSADQLRELAGRCNAWRKPYRKTLNDCDDQVNRALAYLQRNDLGNLAVGRCEYLAYMDAAGTTMIGGHTLLLTVLTDGTCWWWDPRYGDPEKAVKPISHLTFGEGLYAAARSISILLAKF